MLNEIFLSGAAAFGTSAAPSLLAVFAGRCSFDVSKV
jgi:hypothetical protein